MNYSEVLNKMKLLSALWLCIILIMSNVSFANSTNSRTQVSIFDSKDNRQRLITDAKQLNRFHYFWSQKQPLRQEHNYDWRYQISIEEPGGTSRWIYDPKGFVGEITLSKTKVIYYLTPVRSFNRFLMEE